jgi:hypothetical protein
VIFADSSVTDSTEKWIETLSQKTRRACPNCRHFLQQHLFFKSAPSVLVLEYPFRNIITSHSLEFDTGNGKKTLNLRGIVYHGQHHFTSRIVSSNKQLWYHDGITTGNMCINDGLLAGISDDGLRQCRERDLVLAVYAAQL